MPLYLAYKYILIDPVIVIGILNRKAVKKSQKIKKRFQNTTLLIRRENKYLKSK